MALCTPYGLWLPTGPPYEEPPYDGSPNGPPPYERVSWHLINKATWRSPTLTLIEVEDLGELEGAQVMGERAPRSVRVAIPRALPQEVRQRVTRSVRYSAHHSLAPTGGVRVVARRVPGQDGLVWRLHFDPGTDADDPLLREQAGRLLAAAQRSTVSLG